MLSNFMLPISVPAKEIVLDLLNDLLPVQVIDSPLTPAVSPFAILAVEVKITVPLLESMLSRTTSNGPKKSVW